MGKKSPVLYVVRSLIQAQHLTKYIFILNQLNLHFIECAQDGNRNSEVDQEGNINSMPNRNQIINNEIILESRNAYFTERANTNKPKLITKQTFEEKLINLRNGLAIMKIDWRDAHCDMSLTRDNTLKQSMKQFEKIDPYKV